MSGKANKKGQKPRRFRPFNVRHRLVKSVAQTETNESFILWARNNPGGRECVTRCVAAIES